MVIAGHLGTLGGPIDKVNLQVAEAPDGVADRLRVGGLLGVLGRGVAVAQHGRRDEEEDGGRVVGVDEADEVDEGVDEVGRVDGIAHAQVAEVVGAEVDDDGVGDPRGREGEAAVGVEGAVARVDDGHGRLRVGRRLGVVADQALAAPGDDAVVGVQGPRGDGAVGEAVVLQRGRVGARQVAVEPVADRDGVADDLDLALGHDGEAEDTVGDNVGDAEGAKVGLGALAHLDRVVALRQRGDIDGGGADARHHDGLRVAVNVDVDAGRAPEAVDEDAGRRAREAKGHARAGPRQLPCLRIDSSNESEILAQAVRYVPRSNWPFLALFLPLSRSWPGSRTRPRRPRRTPKSSEQRVSW